MNSSLLGTENFTIDSSSWSIQDAIGSINGERVSIKVKIHPEWDVWEYVSWMPASFVGQQLFTYNAALRETQKINKTLVSDQEALVQAIETMSGATEIEQYNNYFTLANIQLTWCYSLWLHIFDDIWVRWYYRLDDWTRLNLNADTRGVARRDESMGYSVRVA